MWGVWAGKGVLTQVLPAHHKDAIEALYKAQVSQGCTSEKSVM